jgi:hypothetical protein
MLLQWQAPNRAGVVSEKKFFRKKILNIGAPEKKFAPGPRQPLGGPEDKSIIINQAFTMIKLYIAHAQVSSF